MTKLLKNIFVFAVVIAATTLFSVTANAKDVATYNRAEYTVSEGRIYWESSDHMGIGRHNTICEENRYTDVEDGKLAVRIDGYSIINKDGNILESYFNEKVQNIHIPEIAEEQELMVHIWGAGEAGFRLGWINFKEIDSEYTISEIPKGKEEKWLKERGEKSVGETADTLKKQVDEDLKIPRMSYILADFSGSMIGFQSDVLEKLEGTSGIKFIFANNIEEYIPGKECNIGATTDIANALNKVNMPKDSHVYILSDLLDNCGTDIELNKDFVGEITIVYYPANYTYANRFMERLRASYPNAKITGF